MPQFKSKEEYERWKAEKIKQNKQSNNVTKEAGKANVTKDAGELRTDTAEMQTFSTTTKAAYKTTNKKLHVSLLIFIGLTIGVVVAYFAIRSLSLNQTPPEYIKKLAAYSEGDGVVVYFIFADSQGVMTTSDGDCLLQIKGTSSRRYNVEELYSQDAPIRKEEFEKTKIGTGTFQHDAIVYSFGRIPYSRFTEEPIPNDMASVTLVCTVPAGGKTIGAVLSAREEFFLK
jgi:hypothetical protein